MPKGKSNLDWSRVDTATLPPETLKLYKAIDIAKKKFEDSFGELVRKAVPTIGDKGLKFGYNFGGLSFAVMDAPATATKTFAFPTTTKA